MLLLSPMALCDSGLKFERMIRMEAYRQGVNGDLAVAVAKTESSLNPNAKGSKGEIGLFQIMPQNEFCGDLKSIERNIKCGVSMLKNYSRVCQDMGKYYVICYNQGPNRRPKHPEKHPYYLKVVGKL